MARRAHVVSCDSVMWMTLLQPAHQGFGFCIQRRRDANRGPLRRNPTGGLLIPDGISRRSHPGLAVVAVGARPAEDVAGRRGLARIGGRAALAAEVGQELLVEIGAGRVGPTGGSACHLQISLLAPPKGSLVPLETEVAPRPTPRPPTASPRKTRVCATSTSSEAMSAANVKLAMPRSRRRPPGCAFRAMGSAPSEWYAVVP